MNDELALLDFSSPVNRIEFEIGMEVFRLLRLTAYFCAFIFELLLLLLLSGKSFKHALLELLLLLLLLLAVTV